MDRIDVRGQFPQEFNLLQASAVIRNALQAAQQAFNGALVSVTPQSVSDRLADVLTAWAAAVRRCRSDSLSSSAAQAAAEKAVTADAWQAIADLEQLYGVALETYKRTIADDLPTLDAGLHAKLWARLERQLDAGVQVELIIDEATADELTVLSEELKSWRRVQMPDDARAANYLHQGDVELLRHRRYALATPAQRQRLDIVEGVKKGEYRTVISFQQARHALGYLKGSATDVEVVLPGWGMTERTIKL